MLCRVLMAVTVAPVAMPGRSAEVVPAAPVAAARPALMAPVG
jgi:hypothetical protein